MEPYQKNRLYATLELVVISALIGLATGTLVWLLVQKTTGINVPYLPVIFAICYGILPVIHHFGIWHGDYP